MLLLIPGRVNFSLMYIFMCLVGITFRIIFEKLEVLEAMFQL